MVKNDGNLKYPVLLVHGMGFRDRKILNYWGRIPKLLESKDIEVFYGNQDSNGTIIGNAKQLSDRIDSILLSSNKNKLNIICHSKAGLEVRYLISSLNYESKIASLTTLSTPHNGSKTIDLLMKAPRFIIKFGCFFVDVWNKILGDESPNTFTAISSLQTEKMRLFNKENPDRTQVYYQSYSFVMKNLFSDIFLLVPWILVYLVEGENDGLLTPHATKWTNYKGIKRGNSRRGISHNDEVDFRRKKFTKKNGENVSDILEVYEEIIDNLIEKGL